MTLFQHHRFGLPAVVFAVALLAGAAQASVVTQTVALAATNIFTDRANGTAPVTMPLTTTFNKFDTSLGTLTGVSFSYDYEFQDSIVLTAQGIGGITVSGPLAINGVVAKTNNVPASTTTTTVYSSGTFAVKKLQLLVDNALADFSGAGTFDFSYLFSGVVGGSVQAGGTIKATLNLMNTSNVAVNYTYTAAPAAIDVPEPSALALVLLGGMALVLQRRSTRARPVPPARMALA